MFVKVKRTLRRAQIGEVVAKFLNENMTVFAFLERKEETGLLCHAVRANQGFPVHYPGSVNTENDTEEADVRSLVFVCRTIALLS